MKLRAAFGTACAIGSALALLSLQTMARASEPAPSPAEASGKTRTVQSSPFSQVDWDYWAGINSHIIGWIDIPKINISLPLAQANTSEPNRYLNHDAFGKPNIYGCAFIDSSCKDRGIASRCTLIYAHHMNDGSMFSKLAIKPRNSRLKAYIQTRKERETVKLEEWKVVNADKEKVRTRFKSWEDYSAWYQEVFRINNAETTTSRTICFATCSYGLFANQRTLVYGKAVKLEETPQT